MEMRRNVWTGLFALKAFAGHQQQASSGFGADSPFSQHHCVLLTGGWPSSAGATIQIAGVGKDQQRTTGCPALAGREQSLDQPVLQNVLQNITDV